MTDTTLAADRASATSIEQDDHVIDTQAAPAQPAADTAPAPSERPTAESATNADVMEIAVESIRVDAAFNPRKKFDDADIAEFAARIHESGWLSPPLVRPDPYGDGFLLVAGERRLRAIRHLGWLTVQVTVKAMTDTEHRKLALVENVDRRDLSIAEEALASRDYLAAYEGDHAAAAAALGWPVARLRHRLKLLHASPMVIEALMNGTIQLGHAELLTALPAENQDKALPRIVADGISVAALREQINGFVTPLSSAIFNTAGCANCVFNTSCQGTLFEARVADGNCTNKPCFSQKTEDALEAKRIDLKSDFGTVVLISERAADQWVPLVKHGDTGVGQAQFDACRSCEFRGAAIHDAPGPRQGNVESPLCFNTSCHARHVESYRAEMAEAAASSSPDASSESTASRSPAGAKANSNASKGKSKPKPKAKAQSVATSVADQYREIAARAGREAMDGSPAFGLALAVYALTTIAGTESGTDYSRLLEGVGAGIDKLDIGGDTARLAKLAAQPQDVLLAAIQTLGTAILTEGINKRQFNARIKRQALLPLLAQRAGVALAKHVVIDKAFLDAHTKPAIEAVLDESGFRAWMEAQDDGGKRFKALVGGRKDDLVAGVLDAGFDFSSYVPSGYDGQVAAWLKEASLKPDATGSATGATEGEGEAAA